MRFIAHRANIEKKVPGEENSPDKILHCINLGYDVEIDVWDIEGNLYLGHDEPQYSIKPEFLLDGSLWCHAKNPEALLRLRQIGAHCFWHQNDDYTITSRGLVWVYPDKPLLINSVAVMPEICKYNLSDLKMCYGICSDQISLYRSKFLKGDS